ncbi:hypothetical protein, partial [uncultured Acetatifactor sp.]|uniref:hypothetical protein n=1 Tax=uncultured Acetatifactor sp. TaxID=1671927 RepID=UPI0026150CB2
DHNSSRQNHKPLGTVFFQILPKRVSLLFHPFPSPAPACILRRFDGSILTEEWFGNNGTEFRKEGILMVFMQSKAGGIRLIFCEICYIIIERKLFLR